MKRKTLIFGGTTEGRALCEAFSANGREATVCTATAYGGSVVAALPHIITHSERMDAAGMAAFIANNAFETVVDATHPYADAATRHIREACEKTGRAYIRVVREEEKRPPAAVRCVPDMEAAVDYLANTTGNVFLATGSKDLARFCRLSGYRERLYVRVLPDAEVMARCKTLGFRGDRIIAMQGPFSHALNAALLKEFSCAFLVTKSTGSAGGLGDKISAAVAVGAEVVCVERPATERGYTLNETLGLLGLPMQTEKEKT